MSGRVCERFRASTGERTDTHSDICDMKRFACSDLSGHAGTQYLMEIN